MSKPTGWIRSQSAVNQRHVSDSLLLVDNYRRLGGCCCPFDTIVIVDCRPPVSQKIAVESTTVWSSVQLESTRTKNRNWTRHCTARTCLGEKYPPPLRLLRRSSLFTLEGTRVVISKADERTNAHGSKTVRLTSRLLLR